MRSELTILEQIDLYLTGKMPPAEQAIFEQQIAESPDLANQLEKQKELIRAVNRKALRAQIASVAAAGAGGAGGGLSNLWIGIGSVIAVGVTTTAIVYYNSDKGNTPPIEKITNNTIEVVNVDSLDSDTFYPKNEGTLILEQPETIFSSLKNYEEGMDDGDQMNVSVKFQRSGEGQIDLSNNNSGSVVSEEASEYVATEVPETSNIRAVNRSSRANFPGGNIAMDKFIDKNLNYPKSAWDKAIEGVVRCDFQVTADGIISEIDAKCIKMNEKNGPAFSEMRQLMSKKIANAFVNNATHILRTMPSWEAARNSQGNRIISFQRMYFNYDMEYGCLVYQLEDETGDVQIDYRSEEEFINYEARKDMGKGK